MSVAVLTTFPQSFVAGDTLRVEISNADYPSSDWGLKVKFDGPTPKTFDADAGDADAFELIAEAEDTAAMSAGEYNVVFIFTETISGERHSVAFGKTQVLQDPLGTLVKSIARRTLEAMEAALEKLAAGANITVNFNGQSFTKKNLSDLQDAISRQRAIVDSEINSGDLVSGVRPSSGIGVRFA